MSQISVTQSQMSACNDQRIQQQNADNRHVQLLLAEEGEANRYFDLAQRESGQELRRAHSIFNDWGSRKLPMELAGTGRNGEMFGGVTDLVSHD